MFCGTFDEFCKAENEKKVFDLIFLSHVLEHIVNPYEFIKECEKINSKYIFIEVPTFDYKFIDEPYAMFNDQHVNIFTLESLQNIMNRCGYSLLEAEMFMGRSASDTSRLSGDFNNMGKVTIYRKTYTIAQQRRTIRCISGNLRKANDKNKQYYR